MFILLISTYILLLLLINISTYHLLNKSLLFNILVTLVYFLFIVFRPISLPDNEFYVETYQYFELTRDDIGAFNLSNIINVEIGFYFLLSECRLIFGPNNYQLFFLTVSLINFVLFFRGSNLILRKLGYNKGSITTIFLPLFIIYISYYGFYYNLIVLRAGIAISLLYYAVALKMSNKNIGFVVALILSLLFHKTAVIGIIVVLSVMFIPSLTKRQYTIIWIVIALIFILKIDQFFSNIDFNAVLGLSDSKDESLFGSYLSRDQVFGRYPFRILYLLLITPVFIAVNNKYTFKFLNVFLIGLFIQCLFQSIPAMSRATDFFIFFSIILSLLTYINIKKITNKNIFLTITIVVNFVMLLRLALIR